MSSDSFFDPLNSLRNQTLASQAAADALIGPPFMGWITHFLLFGCVATNFFNYLGTTLYAEKDSLRTKLLLWGAVCADGLATGVNVWQCFYHGTSQKRDAYSLFMVEKADCVPEFLMGISATLVQLFLAHRAARLFQRRRALRVVFLVVVDFLIFVSFVSSMGTGIAFVYFVLGIDYRLGPMTFNIIAGVFLWVSAGVDLIITVTLVFSLKSHMVGFNETTDSALRRIINLAMRTAAVTTTFDIIGALLSTSFPQSNPYTSDALFAFLYPLGSLYCLSLISTLSSRRVFKIQTPSLNRLDIPSIPRLRASGIMINKEDGIPASPGKSHAPQRPIDKPWRPKPVTKTIVTPSEPGAPASFAAACTTTRDAPCGHATGIMSTNDLDALNTLTGQAMASQAAATALLGPPFMVVLWTVVGLEVVTVGVNVWQCFFHATVQRRDALTLFLVEYGDAAPLFLIGIQSVIVKIFLARRAGMFFLFNDLGIDSVYSGLNFNSMLGIFLWLSAGTDVIITVALVFSLRRHIVGFNQNTDSALRKIISLSMRTAFFTSLIGILGAVFSTSFPATQVSTINALFAFTYPLGSLYTLSLLSTLASRKGFGSGQGTTAQLPTNTRATGLRLSGIMVQQEVCKSVDLEEQLPAFGRRDRSGRSKKEVELEAGESPWLDMEVRNNEEVE
ncbi:hypothetical protein MNV49_003561 [Pseudohyphozyma bogoriensis]|nr:hypothetical protein MNV49_003561 [Pseudohyphozyma bogoriensis]